MKTWFLHLACRMEKRRRAAALQDAGGFSTAPISREASWTAPVLWRFGILLIALIFAGNIFAADIATDFSAANKLYAQGKFLDAAKAYETIFQTGATSPALLFNYGNAQFKCGRLGRAIAAYRKAAQLTPRNPDVRANLAFARNQTTGPALRASRWESWLGALTLNEWAVLAAIAFWLMFALLAAMQIRPGLKTSLRRFTFGAGIVAIVLCAGAGADTAIHFSKQTAVVVTADAIARSGPFDEAQTAFMPHDGAELGVLDRREGWLQVADGSGKIGWLKSKQAEVLPGT